MKRRYIIQSLLILVLLASLSLLVDRKETQGLAISVLTARYDQARTGANINETILNTSNVNVNQFGMLFTRSTVGDTYAQPLYVPGLTIPGQGTHNVVFVATMHNNVYAYDADDPTASTPLWQDNFGAPYTAGGDPVHVPPWDIWGKEVGILGTPVIDVSTGTMYLVSDHDPTSTDPAEYKLHALDITTGAEKFGGPTIIHASVSATGSGSSNGTLTFDSTFHLQRPALLLLNGNVYIAFGATADSYPWHGWVLSYSASNVTQQTGVWVATPSGNGAGIWSVAAMASDGTSIYLSTGNGTFTANTGGADYGDGIVKLSPSLAVQTWFTPYDQSYLNSNDLDLGVTGPMLIPNTNLIIGGGKEGKLYLLDRTNMGGFNAANDNQIVQEFQAASGHQHNTPIYWNGPNGPSIYIWTELDYAKAFMLSNGQLSTIPFTTSQSPVLTNGMPSGILALSSNGSTAGTGIVWGTQVAQAGSHVGTLYAMDAMDLTNILWSSDMNGTRDALGNIAKFNQPTVVNGKVYMATFSDRLDVYGQLGTGGTATPTSTVAGTVTATLTKTPTSTPTGTAIPTNTPPPGSTFYRAININGPALTIDGNNWEGSSAPNYTITGWAHSNQGITLIPPTDANRATMIHSSNYGYPVSFTMNSMPNGTYSVFLYTWDDYQPKTYSVLLNGSVVLANYYTGPVGTWAKLGPWTANVTNGTFTLSTSGEMANFSGIEVWNNNTGTATATTNTPTATATTGTATATTNTPTATATTGTATATTNTPTATATTGTATATSTSGTPGTFYRAININGPALTIDGNNWEGSGAPNYTVNGWGFCNQSVALNPPTDTNRTTMIRCSNYNYPISFTMSSVPNGSYNVYLYTWQDAQSKVFSIYVNGTLVLNNYNSGPAGSWAKLGPWPVNVTNGSITVSSSGELAIFSGIEVWNSSSSNATPTGSSTVTATATPTNTSTPSTAVSTTVTPTNTSTPSATAVSTTVTPTNTSTPGASTFYRAININGSALTIDGNNWEGSNAPNYTVGGWTFCNQSVTLNPPTDANRATMIRCSNYNPTMSFTMSAIPNGSYNVYLYTWQDYQVKVYNIYLNGTLVVGNYNTGPAGSWARLGPWPVTVSNGSFTLTTSGEMANFSGVEVWSNNPATATPTATGSVAPTFQP